MFSVPDMFTQFVFVQEMKESISEKDDKKGKWILLSADYSAFLETHYTPFLFTMEGGKKADYYLCS